MHYFFLKSLILLVSREAMKAGLRCAPDDHSLCLLCPDLSVRLPFAF